MDEKEKLFGIQYSYDSSKPMNLKLKCLQVLNMLGGLITIKACGSLVDNTQSAILTVEVEGL